MTIKLREQGIYRFKDREYVAVPLGQKGKPWAVTGLVYWPQESSMPQDIIYLRHATGEILDVEDFEKIGTVMDLTDTGRTDRRDQVPRR